jgi:hypothetical protein
VVEMAGARGRNRRSGRARALAVVGTLVLLAVGGAANAAGETAGRIERIELKDDGASTKVIVMLSRPLAFDVTVLDGDAAKQIARRLVLDFPDATLAPEASKPIAVANDLLQRIRPGQFNAKTARIVLDLASDATHSVDAFETPAHVTIALGGKTAGAPPPSDTATETKPSVAGTTTAAGVSATAPSATEKKPAAKPIPIRARGRQPYSLNYAR